MPIDRDGDTAGARWAPALRLWPIDFGLPRMAHPDEPLTLERALVRWREGNPNPQRFAYPPLSLQIMAAVLGVTDDLGHAGRGPAWDAERRTALYPTGRATTAVLGPLTVLVVFVAGRTSWVENPVRLGGPRYAAHAAFYDTLPTAAVLRTTIVFTDSPSIRWMVGGLSEVHDPDIRIFEPPARDE